MDASKSEPWLHAPTEMQKLRFEYAWKWFSFHAEQRTKMFNFMLIGLGIFASGMVASFNGGQFGAALALSIWAVLLASAFMLLDKRNRQLYAVALDVLINAERMMLFGEGHTFADHTGKKVVDFGIARRIALEQSRDPEGWEGWKLAVRQGRHRYLMPAVAWIFIILFTLAAVIAIWFMLPSTVEPETVDVTSYSATLSPCATPQVAVCWSAGYAVLCPAYPFP